MAHSLEEIRMHDQADPLHPLRQRFRLPADAGRPYIYFLGNSLGLQPVAVSESISSILEGWARWGVEGFFEGEKPWIHYHDQLAQPLARIVGALPSEIVVMNQLTTNLHLMLVSFYRPCGKRRKILCEAQAFPSDQYMLETHLRHLGLDPDAVIIELQPRIGEHTLRTEDIQKAIDLHREELALVLFSGINYYTGQFFDLPAIVSAGHRAGARVGFDLAHAAGNVALQLHEWNVDFACWCSYKYLNAGPGAVGGVFIHERFHRDPEIHRFGGWWGYDKETRFLMQKGFRPIPSAEGWQQSTPPLLLYASLKASLDLFEEAGIMELHRKRELLSQYLWNVVEQVVASPAGTHLEILTPGEVAERGCQLSLLVKQNGRQLYEQLMKRHIMVDWREPDVIRFAPVPLYNTYEEVYLFGEALRELVNAQ